MCAVVYISDEQWAVRENPRLAVMTVTRQSLIVSIASQLIPRRPTEHGVLMYVQELVSRPDHVARAVHGAGADLYADACFRAHQQQMGNAGHLFAY